MQWNYYNCLIIYVDICVMCVVNLFEFFFIFRWPHRINIFRRNNYNQPGPKCYGACPTVVIFFFYSNLFLSLSLSLYSSLSHFLTLLYTYSILNDIVVVLLCSSYKSTSYIWMTGHFVPQSKCMLSLSLNGFCKLY